ncbi:MAG TPA: hypothetical protein VHW24_27240 [Bryobacteraceae bacterium]|nr:hypothetical protein [Bryobacteraceae bacterium]
MFVVNGPQTGLLTVFALTTYPALLIGLNSSPVSLENGQLKTSFGPVSMPAPRRTLAAADVIAIRMRLIQAAAGRGGRYERYTLVAYPKAQHRSASLKELSKRATR